LWLGVTDPTGGLAQLQHRLEDECAGCGFPREERPFHPHLTIARLRSPEGARRLAALHKEAGFEATVFSVSELIVLRSELGAGGSRYFEISRHDLRRA
jgi:2'-5' RNA ligase